MKPTDIKHPDYFHKVVDCQWACPAHTPVPEYIRLIAAGRYGDAYLVNWQSNVFPGILGRTCDRPCEPACRRRRVEEGSGEHRRASAAPEPVAICRLKRVAADYKEDIRPRLPKPARHGNGKRIASIFFHLKTIWIPRANLLYYPQVQHGASLLQHISNFCLGGLLLQ